MKCLMICLCLGLVGWAVLLLSVLGLVNLLGPAGAAVVVGVPITTTILGIIWLERQAPPAPED